MKAIIIALVIIMVIAVALVYTIRTAPAAISRKFRHWRRDRKHRKMWSNPEYRRQWVREMNRATQGERTALLALPASTESRNHTSN